MKELIFPIESKQCLLELNAGEEVSISGIIYTARDAAHKRICEYIEKGKELPFQIKGQAVYYTGPCPAPEGFAIGSCGPTTSGRMDAYAPTLIKLGLAAMIGKGPRSQEVCRACAEEGSVYFAAAGGAGAYMASCVKECEVIAFEELQSEAVHRLKVDNMKLVVAVDAHGCDLYKLYNKD